MLQENEALIFQKKSPNVSQAGAIYSGNNSLTNQRLNSLNKDINDLNESMEFFQSAYNDKLKNLGGEVQKPEEEINVIREKTSEKLTVFWCFQGVEKGCIGNKWVIEAINPFYPDKNSIIGDWKDTKNSP